MGFSPESRTSSRHTISEANADPPRESMVTSAEGHRRSLRAAANAATAVSLPIRAPKPGMFRLSPLAMVPVSGTTATDRGGRRGRSFRGAKRDVRSRTPSDGSHSEPPAGAGAAPVAVRNRFGT